MISRIIFCGTLTAMAYENTVNLQNSLTCFSGTVHLPLKMLMPVPAAQTTICGFCSWILFQRQRRELLVFLVGKALLGTLWLADYPVCNLSDEFVFPCGLHIWHSGFLE